MKAYFKYFCLISSLLFFMGQSCRTGTPPVIDMELYAGDSAKAGITRAQTNKTIYCVDQEVNNYVCMTYDDYAGMIKMYENSCAQWNNATKKNLQQLRSCGLEKQVMDCFNEN
jgi:hypothetical protein